MEYWLRHDRFEQIAGGKAAANALKAELEAKRLIVSEGKGAGKPLRRQARDSGGREKASHRATHEASFSLIFLFSGRPNAVTPALKARFRSRRARASSQRVECFATQIWRDTSCLDVTSRSGPAQKTSDNPALCI